MDGTRNIESIKSLSWYNLSAFNTNTNNNNVDDVNNNKN